MYRNYWCMKIYFIKKNSIKYKIWYTISFQNIDIKIIKALLAIKIKIFFYSGQNGNFITNNTHKSSFNQDNRNTILKKISFS